MVALLKRPILALGLALSSLTLGYSQEPVVAVAETNAISKSSNLQVHWQAQIELPSTTTEPVSIVIWPHSRDKKETVTIRVGGRIVEQVSGDTLDREAWGKMLVESTSNQDAKPTGAATEKKVLAAAPRLGIEGARAKALVLENRLNLLGRRYEREEVNRPMIYLVTASSNGAVQAIDAESGEQLWTTYVGLGTLKTLGAGVSDDYVTVINGIDLYVLSLRTGRLLNTRRLAYPAGAGAVPLGNWVFVPGMKGYTVAYHATNVNRIPWTQSSAGAGYRTPVVSSDRQFVAWSAVPSYVNIAKVNQNPDTYPTLWSRFHGTEKLYSPPLAVDHGFAIASLSGTITRMGLPTPSNTNVRGDSIEWRFSSGQAIDDPMVFGSGKIFAVNASSELLVVEASSGLPAWNNEIAGVKKVLSVGKDFVYVQTLEGRMLVLDLRDGQTVDSSSMAQGEGFTNLVNDRVLIVSRDGRVTCLREPDAAMPIVHLAVESVGPAEGSGKKKNAPTAPSNNSNDMENKDPFGSSPNGDPGNADADPFGAPSAGNDPLGGAAPDSDPFGSPPPGNANGSDPFGF